MLANFWLTYQHTPVSSNNQVTDMFVNLAVIFSLKTFKHSFIKMNVWMNLFVFEQKEQENEEIHKNCCAIICVTAVFICILQFAQLISTHRKLGAERFPLIEQTYYANYKEMVRGLFMYVWMCVFIYLEVENINWISV